MTGIRLEIVPIMKGKMFPHKEEHVYYSSTQIKEGEEEYVLKKMIDNIKYSIELGLCEYDYAIVLKDNAVFKVIDMNRGDK